MTSPNPAPATDYGELVKRLRASADDGTYGAAADAIVALVREVGRQERIVEIERNATLHNNVCRDHYDKVHGRCVLCRLEQAESRADQLAAEVAMLRSQLRAADDRADMRTRERDTAIREKHDHVKAFDRDHAIEHWRQRAEQAQAALRMVNDTMADIDRCEASVLCSECQAIKDAMLSGVQAALSSATREGASRIWVDDTDKGHG